MTYDSMGSAETTIIGDSGSSLGRIDQYELVCELGGGGFGTVYLAKDTVSGIDVAVKGLPPLVRNSREEMENIRSNFALVSRLTHTNIAKALVLHPAKSVAYASEDVRGKLRVDSGDTLMVMEYAPGVTLSQWRKQYPDRKVPVAKALEITRQIASALDYAHDRRIVHRDIKPANVMIETAEDGAVTARVLDFGLAAEIRTSMGRMSLEIRDKSGTRPYMAPEQWLGGKQGPATDQYALAVLFNELVTGEVPFASVFETGDPVVMMNVVGREPFSPSNELPKAVRNALARALAKKPEERFASCRDFVAALEGNRSSRAEHVERVGGSAAKWLLAAAALAVLAAGGYFGWVKYDEGVKAREAEAKRIKQEVYELKGKASQARDKNEKEEWRNWPHFDQKAKELEGAFRAGEAAFAKDDFEVARTLFLKVRDNWYWLSSNKVERAKAIAAKAKAEADWRNAEYAKAGELSSKEFAVATNGFASAVSAFDAGAFHASGEEFVKAGKAFENAKAKANAESDRLMAERKKADTDAALAAFRSSPPRYEEGFRLSRTADRDNATIQFYIGVCYDFGYGGAEQDDRMAAEWYRKAAEQGEMTAQFNLGVSYDNGQGVTKDEAEAVKWYRRAAEQGHAGAQNNLGLMCETGRGVAKDYSEAVKWYRKAAEQGDAKGEFNLGDMYEYGKGVEKNLAKARELYRKAAAKGDDSAKKRLASLADAIAITTSGAETRYREGLEMLGIDIESTFRYGPTVRVAPGDNLPDILKNCNDKTTIILSPGEYKGNGSVFMNSKSVRIRGDGDGVVLVKLRPNLDGRGNDNCLLVVENLTFIDGDDNYGVWVEGKARCVVDKCVFKRCGVWIGDSNGASCMSVTRSRIERHQSRGVTCCKATRLYMADSTVLSNSVNNYPVTAHDNSRFVIRNSVIKTNDKNIEGIFAVYTGVLFCIENTSFEGLRYGIKTGKDSTGSVIRCKFKDMLYCAIENEGSVQTYLNTFSGTAKKFALDSAVRESSSSITINKNMLR